MSASLVIPTERQNLTLRQLSIEDAPAYFEAVDANRKHLSQFEDETASKYPDLPSVEQSILEPSNPHKIRFGIWDDDAFVGSINLTPNDNGKTAEVGCWLDGRHTGNGYATLATTALSGYASPKFQKLYAEIVDGNEASVRVLERAGYHQTAKKAGRLVFELDKNHETSTGLVIRDTRIGDAQALQPTLEKWIRDRNTDDVLEHEVASVMKAINESTEAQNNKKYVVAEDYEGNVVGVMGMANPGKDMQPYTKTDKTVEFINAYIDPAYRGLGTGKLLAKILEEKALQAGYTKIIVNSGPRYKDTGWAFWTSLYGEPVAVQKDLYGPGGHAPIWSKSLATAK
jgi:RimJ/RimL family protein N-acetyltransferase/GNAT superfamily N-acetyltransferase